MRDVSSPPVLQRDADDVRSRVDCRTWSAELLQVWVAKRALTEGVNAWVDPEGYRGFIAQKKHAFEEQVDLEMGVPTKSGK